MNLVDSFLLVTAFSYLAALILPIQFEKKMSLLAQKIMYLILFVVLFMAVAYFNTYPRLWVLLGVPYSFIAVYCFGGGQDWGSPNNNIVMAIWDLIIAICCLMKLTF
jgi:Ca2+/Na+ antiporter